MADDRNDLWSHFFHTSAPLPELPHLRCVACQEAFGPGYHIVPPPRSKRGFAIFQYSLAGCGSFHDHRGDRRLPAGCGFLCHSDDPVVHYRFPPQARRPWRFVYATWYCPRSCIDAINRQDPIFRLKPDHTLIRSMLSFEHVRDRHLHAARSTELATRFIVALAAERDHAELHSDNNLRDRIRLLCKPGQPIPDTSGLAKLLGWSREHLSRRFREEHGSTLYQQLLRWRLERATDLLRGSLDIEIAAIAQQTGFSDSGHLARHFKQLHGLTPSQYRSLARAGSDI